MRGFHSLVLSARLPCGTRGRAGLLAASSLLYLLSVSHSRQTIWMMDGLNAWGEASLGVLGKPSGTRCCLLVISRGSLEVLGQSLESPLGSLWVSLVFGSPALRFGAHWDVEVGCTGFSDPQMGHPWGPSHDNSCNLTIVLLRINSISTHRQTLCTLLDNVYGRVYSHIVATECVTQMVGRRVSCQLPHAFRVPSMAKSSLGGAEGCRSVVSSVCFALWRTRPGHAGLLALSAKRFAFPPDHLDDRWLECLAVCPLRSLGKPSGFPN
jgi:hypothetical protein